MNKVLTFNPDELGATLQSMPRWCGLAFAASIATRMFPCYLAFSSESQFGRPEVLQESLAYVWNHILSESIPQAEIDMRVKACDEQVPEAEMTSRFRHPYGLESAAAVEYSVRALGTTSVQDVIWAAQCGYTVVDSFVVTSTELSYGTPENECLIVMHPVIQRELQRRQRDLDMLRGHACESPATLVARLKAQAEHEHILPE